MADQSNMLVKQLHSIAESALKILDAYNNLKELTKELAKRNVGPELLGTYTEELERIKIALVEIFHELGETLRSLS